MNLSKLGLVREFIDYMIKEYSKDLYFCYRASGYTPKEIMSKPCWEDRMRDCLDLAQISYNTGVSLDEYIDGFSKDYYGLSYETHCGAQQVAFIFDDEVYKVTSATEVCDEIISFKQHLGEYGHFIAETNYIEDYKGIIIYKQEKVNTDYDYNYDEDKAISSTADDLACYIDDEDLAFQIGAELKYDDEKINELYDLFNNYDRCCGFDIHSGNWGTINGKVKIYDPFYM